MADVGNRSAPYIRNPPSDILTVYLHAGKENVWKHLTCPIVENFSDGF
jgi:hypothetical protein